MAKTAKKDVKADTIAISPGESTIPGGTSTEGDWADCAVMPSAQATQGPPIPPAHDDRFAESAAMLATRMDQIQRALAALKGAERYEWAVYGSRGCMERNNLGLWMMCGNVLTAIQILQEAHPASITNRNT
jgi:hypothetical protein